MKNKSLAQKLGLLTACALLIADVVFLATDLGDHTFSFVTFGAVLLGAVLLGASFFLPRRLDFLPLLAAAALGVGLGMHLFLGLPTLSDLWNGVNFVGGNSTAVFVFGAIYLAGTILSVVLCFGKQDK